mmetsp:Transcript_17970/g.27357  ORF Transcript_17970/g.27357 Transcript_17970/m.27357 type:complete len:263 (+) Transcript_17970:128-916(+)
MSDIMKMGKLIRVALLSASFFFFYARALLTVGNLHQRRPTHVRASCLKSMPATSATASSIDKGTHDIGTTSTSQFQNEYTIREALYSELQVIASLVTAGFHPELDSNPILRPIRVLLELDRLQNNFPYPGDENRHLYLVCEAKKDKKVVAFCDIDARIPAKKKENPFLPFASIVNRPHPYFSDLTVDPNYRRKGIASSLVEEGERLAKEMNCQEMYLGVASTNTVALDLYSNMGYEIIVPTGDILEFVKRQEGVRMLRRTLN